MARGWSRRRSDLIGLFVGLALFVAGAAVAAQGLVAGEEALFVAVNSLPDALYYLIWPFMQYGVFLTIPVLIVVVCAVCVWRLRWLSPGSACTCSPESSKELVKRGRPEALIGDIDAREIFSSGSLGFPSGHVAVAAALTVVVTPHLRGRLRAVPAALVVIVGIGRMYVGAHTPLDLLGGAALGVGAGCVANLLIGVPQDPESPDDSGERAHPPARLRGE